MFMQRHLSVCIEKMTVVSVVALNSILFFKVFGVVDTSAMVEKTWFTKTWTSAVERSNAHWASPKPHNAIT